MLTNGNGVVCIGQVLMQSRDGLRGCGIHTTTCNSMPISAFAGEQHHL